MGWKKVVHKAKVAAGVDEDTPSSPADLVEEDKRREAEKKEEGK